MFSSVATLAAVQESRSRDLTLETWDPRFLCMPEHSMQIRMPRLMLAQEGSTAPQGASVPSLGLSNKPVVFQDASQYDAWSRVNEDDRHVKDKFPDFYFNPETHDKPPPEVSKC